MVYDTNMAYIFYIDWSKGAKLHLYKATGVCYLNGPNETTGPRRLALQMGYSSYEDAYSECLLQLLRMDKKYCQFSKRLGDYAQLGFDPSVPPLLYGMTEENVEWAMHQLLIFKR